MAASDSQARASTRSSSTEPEPDPSLDLDPSLDPERSPGAPASHERVDERLRPFERVRRSSEFVRVFDEGRSFRTETLRIRYLATDREYSRLGLVVSRRHGRAVTRNRTKRRLRECFRKLKYELVSPHDLVLLPNGAPRETGEYAADLRRFLEYLKERGARPPRSREPRPDGA